MTDEEFDALVRALRPRLHRFCARMTGSSVDGEDVVQEAMLKALRARHRGDAVESVEPWLFRIAHNTSLDLLRSRARTKFVPLHDELEAEPRPETESIVAGVRTFLTLPELQRCAVILKDVLGHSIDEVASIADCSPAAAKSALQRGRATLRKLADTPEDPRLPLLADEEREKITAFVHMFRTGDFDAIRAMLAEDVKLDLVNRLSLEGKERISPYFSRYAETTRWRFAFGAVEGRPVMLVFDETDMEIPAHFVLITWRHSRITAIRDFLFAPYALEAVDWARLG